MSSLISVICANADFPAAARRSLQPGGSGAMTALFVGGGVQLLVGGGAPTSIARFPRS
jgi:hypothetical protein